MTMTQTMKPKNLDRPRSAGWGKRIGITLLVLAGTVFAQDWEEGGHRVGKFDPDLAPVVARAHQGVVSRAETVKIIVQYKQAPQSEQEGRIQRLGAQLNGRLGVIKGIAVTVPVSALPALEADDEIEAVSVDREVKASDEYTNAAMNVSAAWNAGYNGTGI